MSWFEASLLFQHVQISICGVLRHLYRWKRRINCAISGIGVSYREFHLKLTNGSDESFDITRKHTLTSLIVVYVSVCFCDVVSKHFRFLFVLVSPPITYAHEQERCMSVIEHLSINLLTSPLPHMALNRKKCVRIVESNINKWDRNKIHRIRKPINGLLRDKLIFTTNSTYSLLVFPFCYFFL